MFASLFSVLFSAFSYPISLVLTDRDPSALWPDFSRGGQ